MGTETLKHVDLEAREIPRDTNAAPQRSSDDDRDTETQREVENMLAPYTGASAEPIHAPEITELVEPLPDEELIEEARRVINGASLSSDNGDDGVSEDIGIPVHERLEIEGRPYTVSYLPESEMPGLLGFVFDGSTILIRSDIPKAAQRFVKAHEIAHMKDKNFGKGGWIMNEIRATFGPGLRDPVGLLSTLWTIAKKGKLKYYWHILKTGQLRTYNPPDPPAALKVLEHKYGKLAHFEGQLK